MLDESPFLFDVFLSHNAKDKPRVLRLAEWLKQAGLRVWLDEWIIKPGDDIYLAIEHGLEVSRTLVLCLSPNALGSDWVGLERSTVLFRDPANSGRRFIPLLIADCKLPDSLRRYKYVDCREETEIAFKELLNGLCSVSEHSLNADAWIASQQKEWSDAMETGAELAARLLVSRLTTTTVSVGASGNTFGHPKENTKEFPHRLIWHGSRTIDSLRKHLQSVEEWSKSINIAGMKRPKKLRDLYVDLSLTDDPRKYRLGVTKWNSYTIHDVLQEHASIVILGDPGSGKTTTLKKVAKGFLTGEYSGNVPIVLRLRDIRSGQRLTQMLMSILGIEFEESKDFAEEFAAQQTAQQEALVKENELRARRLHEEESATAVRRELQQLEQREREEKIGRSKLTVLEEKASKVRRERLNELRKILRENDARNTGTQQDERCVERISIKLTLGYQAIEIKALAAFLNSLRVILLLDGFDELDPDTRPGVLDEIRHLQNALSSSSRIVLTCRSADYGGGLDNVLVFEINRLSDGQIDHFVRLWFSSDEGRQRTADDFQAALKLAPYSDLAGRPLSLANLCLVFEKYGALPELPITIYRKILYLLLEEWDTDRGISRRSKYSQFDVSRKIDFLSVLAFKLATRRNKRLTFSTNDLETIYREVYRRFLLPQGESREVAHEIESHTGVVVKASYDSFEFSHKCLQEFLVADYLCRLPDVLDGCILLQDCPNELAIALALTVEPSHWFCRLFRNKKNIRVPAAHWVSPFASRILAERPGFDPCAELGSTVLWMLGNTPLNDVGIRRFLNIEAITESIKLFLAYCVFDIPMGAQREKARITVRGTAHVKYPLPRDFEFDSAHLEFLPGMKTIRRVFHGKIVNFDLKARYGYIETGRPREKFRFDFNSLEETIIPSLNITCPVEYELENKKNPRIIAVRLSRLV